MKYVCKKEFQVNVADGDGGFTGRHKLIRKGTQWIRNTLWGKSNEAHLKNIKNSCWIEIDKEIFKKCFKEQEYNLISNLRKEYFDEVKNGKKKFEYRLFNDYWKKRLKDKSFDNVVIKLGYPKDSEKDKSLKFKYQGYKIETIIHKEFGSKPLKVFAIELEKNKKGEQSGV